MALDPIWQQQLTLVTYGNQYLAQDFSFSRWVNHSIFQQHSFAFRDLISQQLLAQHFQVWLEGLKAQGVTRLSLHCSSLLNDEKNPNTNIELVPYAHFIVSHSPKHKYAWICGRELAAWYKLEQDYEAPVGQEIPIRLETLWRYELEAKLAKRIAADLQTPNWQEIQKFTEDELFLTPFAQGLSEPDVSLPYYGIENPHNNSSYLALLPTDVQADYAHQSLHRLNALTQYITLTQKTAQHADGTTFSNEEHLKYRHFAQKLDDLHGKFIVKVANHYQTAHLMVVASNHTPLDPVIRSEKRDYPAQQHKKVGLGNVLALIFITAMLCAAAYYFGF
jgi:hypothetical protein